MNSLNTSLFYCVISALFAIECDRMEKWKQGNHSWHFNGCRSFLLTLFVPFPYFSYRFLSLSITLSLSLFFALFLSLTLLLAFAFVFHSFCAFETSSLSLLGLHFCLENCIYWRLSERISNALVFIEVLLDNSFGLSFVNSCACRAVLYICWIDFWYATRKYLHYSMDGVFTFLAQYPLKMVVWCEVRNVFIFVVGLHFRSFSFLSHWLDGWRAFIIYHWSICKIQSTCLRCTLL